MCPYMCETSEDISGRNSFYVVTLASEYNLWTLQRILKIDATNEYNARGKFLERIRLRKTETLTWCISVRHGEGPVGVVDQEVQLGDLARLDRGGRDACDTAGPGDDRTRQTTQCDRGVGAHVQV